MLWKKQNGLERSKDSNRESVRGEKCYPHLRKELKGNGG